MFWVIIVFIFAATSARVVLMNNKEDIIEDVYNTLSENTEHLEEEQIQKLSINCYNSLANSLNIVIAALLIALLIWQVI